MSWRGGRQVELGLGGLLHVPLARARERAAEIRHMIGEGRDPVAERRRVRGTPTFGALADVVVASLEAGWRNDKHRAQWRSTLVTHAHPLRDVPINKIGTEDVLQVLKPLWHTKPETASRLRGRIEKILDAGKARGWRDGENPARWRGHLENLLPARHKLTRGHHGAMPYSDVPKFMRRLREIPSTARLALEFCILTCARTSEVLGARWDEIDDRTRVWSIPAKRTKAGRTHRVPLCAGAMLLLSRLRDLRQGEYIFPGRLSDRPLSNMAMTMVLRGMGITGVTVHGFRSSFRDWAAERTQFPREVAELALAHVVANDVERAYWRGDTLEKRRALMQAWGVYCSSGSSTTAAGVRTILDDHAVVVSDK
jgi:integrase